MYAIAKWKETFEAAESRKVKGGMSWIPIETKIDGRGSARLTRRGADGMMAYGVFVRLCQWYANRPEEARNGLLVHTDGEPMDIEHISFALSLDEIVINQAFSMLSDSSINWIVCDQTRSSAINDDQTRSTSLSILEDSILEDTISEEKAPASAAKDDPVQYAEVQSAYNRIIAADSRWSECRTLGDGTKSAIRARWHEFGGYEGIVNAFQSVRDCEFLMHRKNGKTSIAWILGPKNFESVLNGDYRPDEQARASPSAPRNPISEEAHKALGTDKMVEMINGIGRQGGNRHIPKNAGDGIHAVGEATQPPGSG